MNREQIYTVFRERAENDKKYFEFGRTGIIEEVLAYFGLQSKPFRGALSQVHEENLQILHDFLMKSASEEQAKFVYNIAKRTKLIPTQNPCCDASGSVFVSMPMNKERYDCVDEIRAGMDQGIKSTGNLPYFLDLDVHNENIFVKMLEEIQNCKFLVADFTYQNPGVYYEAGYAKAMGKTVIHTCCQSDRKKIHFDISQMQFIFWENASDLSEKLKAQIEKSGLAVK